MDVGKLLAHEERSTIERWVESRARGQYLGGGRALARVLGKYLFYVPTNDVSVVPHLLMDGYWEMWITMAIARRVKPGWRCIDVGANVGYYTILLADLVGDDGDVQAWEVQGDMAECIRRSAHMNGTQSRVQVVNRGASDRDGLIAPKPLNELWDRGSVATESVHQNEHRMDAVPCMRIDDDGWWANQRVDFVKIDTEGHEPQVWYGLDKILKQSPNVEVLLEFTPRLYDNPGEFLDEIRADGFNLRRVDFDGELQPVAAEQILDADGMEMLWLTR